MFYLCLIYVFITSNLKFYTLPVNSLFGNSNLRKKLSVLQIPSSLISFSGKASGHLVDISIITNMNLFPFLLVLRDSTMSTALLSKKYNGLSYFCSGALV